MSNQYFPDQFDDEEVLFVFRKHPVVMRRALIFGSLALLIGVIPSLAVPTYQVFFGGLGAGILLMFAIIFYSWIGWYFSVFIVTDQRFIQITQDGLFKKSVVDLGMDKIQSVSYEVRGIEQTFLGFGTIVIQTYVGELVIKHLHHPQAIQKRLVHTLRELGLNDSSANQEVNEQ